MTTVEGVLVQPQQYPFWNDTTYITSPTIRESLTSPGIAKSPTDAIFAGSRTSSATTRLVWRAAPVS